MSDLFWIIPLTISGVALAALLLSIYADGVRLRAREAAIEECAKIVDGYVTFNCARQTSATILTHVHMAHQSFTAEKIAESIRAMTSHRLPFTFEARANYRYDPEG